ncbi:hypothetical protein E3N88_05405 [Mikania micrantha]|uniref:Uncharacterized protein n=1 Tax=Mikania micrantha TaxID=192012 RepID=A0A5N6PNU8_9ASTR|nr:hypothetical protein E3N88_05405 [Mikania micrantha]
MNQRIFFLTIDPVSAYSYGVWTLLIVTSCYGNDDEGLRPLRRWIRAVKVMTRDKGCYGEGLALIRWRRRCRTSPMKSTKVGDLLWRERHGGRTTSD